MQMSDCCSVPAQPIAGVDLCPISRTRGTPVDVLTVKALLTETALQRVNNVAHRFCPDSSCEVVYFDAEGASYVKEDLRVPVWQKEPFETKLAQLRKFRKTLREYLAQCERSLSGSADAECPVIERLEGRAK
ncbi:MAG: hypothetical protein HY047_10830 [Acidobacteria bacterium]|nr:hypothetical protein [Acidobacteriota bacterium]